MRGRVQLKTQLAIQSLFDQNHHPKQDRAIVCDLAQNITLPRYGDEQSG
jgi:hypothetical protein